MRRHTLIKIRIPASVLTVLLSACGGGGGGGTVSSGGGGGGGAPIASPAANVQTITIDSGPLGTSTNVLFTSVTICVPGTATCQAIDHVLVDTGSNGVRIVSSVLNPSLASVLPPVTSGGNPVAECTRFADGSAWGPVKIADVKISGEAAASVPIQVIGDPDPAFAEPRQCLQSGPAENTVRDFGANGIVGVGEFLQDCGIFCTTPGSGFYFTCPCDVKTRDSGLAVDLQVANPVARFANDNNGVIIELPGINSTGAATVSGALVFGIGTQSNNGLGTARIFKTNTATGYFTTTYKSQTFTFSLLDSGSSAYFFPDSNIAVCTSQNPPQSIALGYYCPQPPQPLSAVIQDTDGTVSAVVPFSVGNAFSLFIANPTYTAFNDIGLPQPNAFIWGLPAFFGRHVYVAIEGQTTSGGAGPYFAF